jgi:hypothetical protein
MESGAGSGGLISTLVSTVTWPFVMSTWAIRALAASFRRRSLLMTPGATLLK